MNEPQDEFPDEPSAEDFKRPIKEARPRGILYQMPRARDLMWPLTLVLLCMIASLLFWRSEQFGPLLYASKMSVIGQKEYWRLLTAIFVHADLRHLLANLPLFFIFGWLLKTYFGALAFPVAALCSGVASNWATVYFYPEYVRLIGASGVVYALVASWVTFYARYEVRFSLPQKMLRIVGVLLVLLFPTSYEPTTSYLAHITGFGFGVLFTIILMVIGPYDRRQRELNRSRGDHSNSKFESEEK